MSEVATHTGLVSPEDYGAFCDELDPAWIRCSAMRTGRRLVKQIVRTRSSARQARFPDAV